MYCLSRSSDAAAHRASRAPDCHHVTSWAAIAAPIDQPTMRRGGQVDEGRHVKPAFRCPDIGKVRDPFAIGCGRVESRDRVRWQQRCPYADRPNRAADGALQGHAFRACSRINRSIRGKSAEYLSGCKVVPHPRGAIRFITTTEARANLAPTYSSLRLRWLRCRVSQAQKPPRATPSASHIQFAGQISQCSAMKPNLTSIPSLSRPLHF